MYKVFSWTCVVLWMMLIFYLSNQPATKSNKLSTGVTEVVVKKVQKVAPNIRLDIKDFNHIVRKNAHFFLYLVLSILVINSLETLKLYQGYNIRLTLLICVTYAISDEIHQLFVAGRGPQVKDVFIDSSGAALGVGVYLLIVQIRKIVSWSVV